jgi:uncharacterized protein YnzC (UPF0291/DUF896 family)
LGDNWTFSEKRDPEALRVQLVNEAGKEVSHEMNSTSIVDERRLTG